MNKLFVRETVGLATVVSAAVLLFCPSVAFADLVTLGSAQFFAVLGGAGVSVNGSCCTEISGDLGDYPLALSSIAGFPTPGTLLNGSFYASDQLPLIAQQAQADENTAYNALAALPSTANETGVILGTGGTVAALTPGVYSFSSTAQVDGTLTLDFTGAPNDSVFVFQIGTGLTTGSDAAIDVIGGNSSDAIYWQVGTSATLGSGTTFAGNILASDSITLDPSASIVCGRAFADTASVILSATNLISDNCSVDNTAGGFSSDGPTDFSSLGFSGGAPASGVPEPSAFLLLGIGFACVLVKYSDRRKRGAATE